MATVFDVLLAGLKAGLYDFLAGLKAGLYDLLAGPKAGLYDGLESRPTLRKQR
jgi:hypothetical protein